VRNRQPLVSLMIPNRNHSAFLGACIESALNQTYGNIEIVFLDNCSDDNSVDVASRYVSHGVRVCRNPHNIINNSYKVLSQLTCGKYLMLLCADDLLKPQCIEKAVTVMEARPDVGYVHCERDYIDGSGTVIDLDPFYRCSFIAPGDTTLPLYLLTDVGQPAQCLMRRTAFESVLGYDTEFDHTNADKDLWFRLSLVSNYAYIREKLSLIRIHEARETTLGYRTFFHPLAIFLTIEHQRKWGVQEGIATIETKVSVAFRKLAHESVQVALLCIKEGNRELARQYLVFAQLIHGEVVDDENYHHAQACLREFSRDGAGMNAYQAGGDLFVRKKRSYDPPEGYEMIEVP